MNPFDDIKVGDVVAYTRASIYRGEIEKTTVTRVLKSSFEIAAAPGKKFLRNCKYRHKNGYERGGHSYYYAIVEPWSAEIEERIRDMRLEKERWRKANEIAAVKWRYLEPETLNLAYAGLASLGIVGGAA